MYIRWKLKPRGPKWGYDEQHIWRSGVTHETQLFIAYLVESKRIDGKPRQKTKYLACIREKYLSAPAHQAHFWKNAHAALEDAHLPVDQRATIETALLQRVSRPSPEALTQNERHLQAMLANRTNRM